MEFIEVIVAFFYFFLGTIIGSFLNVVSLRYGSGKSILGRSECLSCGRELKWFELIPVLSFIFQLGKCRNCKSKISWQYPLVELFTGIVFLGIFLKFSELLSVSILNLTAITLYLAVIFSILIVIFVYDIKHKIIPDGLSYAFAGLAFAGMFFDFSSLQLMTPTLLHLLAGPIFFLSFFCLWFFSRGKWIGLGDGKLSLGIGWFLGFSLGATSITLSFWAGALFGIALITISALNLRAKQITMKSEIPFGPFLILGLMLVFFLNINILNFIL